jgi:hypothetical protein
MDPRQLTYHHAHAGCGARNHGLHGFSNEQFGAAHPDRRSRAGAAYHSAHNQDGYWRRGRGRGRGKSVR